MRKLLLLAPLALAACASAGTRHVGTFQVPEGSKCERSDALDTFKGQRASTELAAQVMAAARAPKLRWVPFGALITMEYNESRVTVRLDQQNRVMSVICG
ncbi:MAG TPA: I78 family peptidase inhibitor [Sphingomicrobium sp.]